MAEQPTPISGGHPVLESKMRSQPSNLKEHQHQPQHEGILIHEGIDSIVDRVHISPPKSPSKLTIGSALNQHIGAPSPSVQPKMVDSGLNHSFSHANCQSLPGTSSDRLVATLIYKSNAPRAAITDVPPDRIPSPIAPAPNPESHVIPANLAPVRSVSIFPLEPPPPGPEPLDNLYGSYISPICITSFLHLIASLPVRQGSDTLSSSHRCLDDPQHPTIVEITFSPRPDPACLTLEDLRQHELIYRFEREWNVDVALQADSVLRHYPRLVVFDMDSTLIEQEVIVLIAASIGVEAEVSAITTRAMNGEIDFSASLRERARLLKGADVNIFTKLRDVVTPTKGARELIRALKKIGCTTAVLSGGFNHMTRWVADSMDIDYAFANTLDSDRETSKLTGELLGPIIDAEEKRSLLVNIAERERTDLQQVIAVGDGANDLLMLRQAGVGVAFKAKPVVQAAADIRLNGDSLLDLLYLFGFTAEEIEVLTA